MIYSTFPSLGWFPLRQSAPPRRSRLRDRRRFASFEQKIKSVDGSAIAELATINAVNSQKVNVAWSSPPRSEVKSDNYCGSIRQSRAAAGKSATAVDLMPYRAPASGAVQQPMASGAIGIRF
jgi:hypothetical protein